MIEAEGNGTEAVRGHKCCNPCCENVVVSHPLASHPRKFCSNECKLDGWALRRVAEMLLPLGQAKGWEILQSRKNGGSEDKARDEIINPRAS